jgi:hypothetical protein
MSTMIVGSPNNHIVQADKKEADKQEQLARLMRDMQTPGASSSRAGSGTAPGPNPFGPHAKNDRDDQ